MNELYSTYQDSVNNGMTSPLNLGGCENNFGLCCKLFPPVIDGMNSVFITYSNGRSYIDDVLMVRI